MTLREKAGEGLRLLKEAICEYIASHPGPNGVPHVDIAHDLDIESDFQGNHKNFLSWSVLGLLLRENKLRYTGNGRGRRWFLNQ